MGVGMGLIGSYQKKTNVVLRIMYDVRSRRFLPDGPSLSLRTAPHPIRCGPYRIFPVMKKGREREREKTEYYRPIDNNLSLINF